MLRCAIENQKNILTHNRISLGHRMLAHGHRMMMLNHNIMLILGHRMMMLNHNIMFTLGHSILRLRQMKSEHAAEHAIRLVPNDDMSLTNKRKTKPITQNDGDRAHIEVTAT